MDRKRLNRRTVVSATAAALVVPAVTVIAQTPESTPMVGAAVGGILILVWLMSTDFGQRWS